MRDNSSDLAGRQTQAIFILNSLELAVSMIFSKQETKSLHRIAGSRKLCLYLLPALAILGQFARQIYEEQEKNMRTETAFELYAKYRNIKHKTKFWNKEYVWEKFKSTFIVCLVKEMCHKYLFSEARLDEAIYYRRLWKKVHSCGNRSHGWALMGSTTDFLQNPKSPILLSPEQPWQHGSGWDCLPSLLHLMLLVQIAPKTKLSHLG